MPQSKKYNKRVSHAFFMSRSNKLVLYDMICIGECKSHIHKKLKQKKQYPSIHCKCSMKCLATVESRQGLKLELTKLIAIHAWKLLKQRKMCRQRNGAVKKKKKARMDTFYQIRCNRMRQTRVIFIARLGDRERLCRPVRGGKVIVPQGGNIHGFEFNMRSG